MESPVTIDYATHRPSFANRVWAAAVIVGAGVALIVLGGCFLIGITGIVQGDGFFGSVSTPTAPLTTGQVTLIVWLCILAASAFAAAIWLIARGVAGLTTIMRG